METLRALMPRETANDMDYASKAKPTQGTQESGANSGLSASPDSISISESDAQAIAAALRAAWSDIWQTLRVSETNLTGVDPALGEDQTPCKPEVPHLIHREGIDQSMRVHEQVSFALKTLKAAIQSNRQDQRMRAD